MVDIAENLHRADDLTELERAEQTAEWLRLTVEERSHHIAEWIRLSEARDRQAAQVAPAVLRDGRKAGPQHQRAGVNAASRDLGIDRTEAQRALKIDTLSPEAKAEAKVLHLDDAPAADRGPLARMGERQSQLFGSPDLGNQMGRSGDRQSDRILHGRYPHSDAGRRVFARSGDK